MSAKARELREKNVVAKLVKDLNKRMESFESAVDELKILKESITSLHDEVTNQEQENKNRLAQLKAELKDNRTRVLSEEAKNAGKILMSVEDVTELKNEVQKWKAECDKIRQAGEEEVKTKVAEAVEHQIQVMNLQHECKTAELTASKSSLMKEIQNLKEAMDRMGNELTSQKELTANIAQSHRPVSRDSGRE